MIKLRDSLVNVIGWTTDKKIKKKIKKILPKLIILPLVEPKNLFVKSFKDGLLAKVF